MKDPRQERLGRLQREYHRHHPWRLGPGGLFVPHSYAEVKPDALSWWDDVGFILNGRRVIVCRPNLLDAVQQICRERGFCRPCLQNFPACQNSRLCLENPPTLKFARHRLAKLLLPSFPHHRFGNPPRQLPDLGLHAHGREASAALPLPLSLEDLQLSGQPGCVGNGFLGLGLHLGA